MRSTRSMRRALLAATLVCIALGGAAVAASASPGRYTLHGTTPGWLSQANNLGAAPSTQPVQFGVLLNMRDQAGAEAKLQAISDPTSASYGQWLSNAAFNASYAPSSADVSAVQDWLRSRASA